METKKYIDVKIASIPVNAFSMDAEKISFVEKEDNINMSLGLTVQAKPKEKLLIASASIAYEKEGNELASLSYSFIVFIPQIEEFTVGGKMNLPENFLKNVIYDTYATGRILMHERLLGSKLQDVYLILGGGNALWEKFKENPRIGIIE